MSSKQRFHVSRMLFSHTWYLDVYKTIVGAIFLPKIKLKKDIIYRKDKPGRSARLGAIGYSGNGLHVVYLDIKTIIIWFFFYFCNFNFYFFNFSILILCLFIFSSVVDHLYASNPGLFESHRTNSGLFFLANMWKLLPGLCSPVYIRFIVSVKFT